LSEFEKEMAYNKILEDKENEKLIKNIQRTDKDREKDKEDGKPTERDNTRKLS